MTWTYPSSFLFYRFGVTFAGTQVGDRMGGVIQASDCEGAFTAERS